MAKKKRAAKATRKRSKAKRVAKAKDFSLAVRGQKVSRGLAVAALVLNLILPGLGSLVGKETKTGIWQLVLFLLGIPLIILVIGIPMIIAAYIWGIVTGIQLIQKSS